MSTTPIQSSTSGSSATVSNPNASLNSSDFVKMMLTELQNQDPLNPTDSQALLSQMSSIGQLQSADQLQSTLTQFSFQNQLAAASNLIGKTVTGLNASSNQTTGLVTGVSAINSQVWLQLDNGDQVQMSNVQQIAPGSTSSTSTTTSGTNAAATSQANQAAAAALLQQLLGGTAQ
ncbi:MAG TPA: flagellar hook capping FlgD N-terminal domain-containing protein [Tepidisphaeraceae bacterium]|nr:flagellar hook capping FlgD N-terminal domain-containing protein [Tepidisphaeraceae bacterium]